jgi:hypothetical protein
MHSYREEVGPHPVSVTQRDHIAAMCYTHGSRPSENLSFPRRGSFVMTSYNALPVPVGSRYIKLDGAEAL